MLLSCREKATPVLYSDLIRSWSAAVKNKQYDQVRKYELYQKTDGEYEEIYSEYYLKDVIVLSVEEISASERSLKIAGKIVMRNGNLESEFAGDVRLEADSSGTFRIKDRKIVRMR